MWPSIDVCFLIFLLLGEGPKLVSFQRAPNEEQLFLLRRNGSFTCGRGVGC